MKLSDKHGAILAAIAKLEAEKKSIEAEMIATNQLSMEGTLFRSTVSFVEPSPRVDWKAVAMHFSPSRQLIASKSNPQTPFYRISTKAKKVDQDSVLADAINGEGQ